MSPTLKTRLGLTALEDRTVPSSVIDNVFERSPVRTVEGATVSFLVHRSGDITSAVTVNYTVSGTDGSANGSGSVAFAIDQKDAIVDLATTDDTVSEPTKTVVLTLAGGTDYTVGTAGAATLNILDNDAQVVSVAKTVDTTEGADNGTFVFTRVGNLGGSLAVNYTVSGTATSGTDFAALSGSVTIPAGEASVDLTLEALDDNIYDPDETVVVALASGTGYDQSSAAPPTMTIADSVRATFTVNSYVGSIKYEIPWGDVDPDQATQSLTATSFNLNIGGQNFAYGVANYTTAPTLLFEYGDLVGIVFDLDLTGTGSSFASISVASGVATAIDAVTTLPVFADVEPVASASITLDFSQVTIPAMGSVKYTLEIELPSSKFKTAEIEVFAGATAEDVRNLFVTSLKTQKIISTPKGTNRLEIQGAADAGLVNVKHIGFGAKPPALIGRTPSPAGTYASYSPGP